MQLRPIALSSQRVVKNNHHHHRRRMSRYADDESLHCEYRHTEERQPFRAKWHTQHIPDSNALRSAATKFQALLVVWL